MFFLTKLDVKKTLMGETYSYCYEVKPTTSFIIALSLLMYYLSLQSWDPPHSRLVYTLVCFVFQYLVPSVVVGIVYTK